MEFYNLKKRCINVTLYVCRPTYVSLHDLVQMMRLINIFRNNLIEMKSMPFLPLVMTRTGYRKLFREGHNLRTSKFGVGDTAVWGLGLKINYENWKSRNAIVLLC